MHSIYCYIHKVASYSIVQKSNKRSDSMILDLIGL